MTGPLDSDPPQDAGSGTPAGGPGNTPPTWLVAATHPRKELLARQQLARQGYATFFPRLHRARAGKASELAPLFPGYLFVALDPQRQDWQPINSTRGVRRLVGAGLARARPPAVPPAAMELLQARCIDGVVTRLVDDLEPGARIKLTTGPFAECIATVEACDARGRVRILLNLLGGEKALTVGLDCLAPLAA